MTKALDTRMLQELNNRKDLFPVDADLLSRQMASSPHPDVLRFIGMLVLWQQPRSMLTFGCGTGVVFLARLQERTGGHPEASLVAVDHSQRCVGETRRALGGSSGVHLVHAPLAVTECAGRVFTTYHPSWVHSVPPAVQFDFVFIDGPPPFRYGREAPLYHIEHLLSPEAMIILDDANTEHGQTALEHWHQTWPDRFEATQFPGVGKGIAVAKISAPGQNGRVAERSQTLDLDRMMSLLTTEGSVVPDGH